MDAKITKQRLGNLLSYDWLKILVVVGIAVVLLVVFFTMVGTRPTKYQTYSIYGYTDLSAGTDEYGLADALENKGVFSYDILKTSVESFSGNEYASTVYTARRMAGEGTVMFVTDLPEYDENGELTQESTLSSLLGDSLYDGKTVGGFMDTRYWMQECESYLTRFFGADWRTNEEPSETAVRDSFLARNGKDKRFRSAANKEAGIAQERARIVKLRTDFLFLEQAFENGDLSHTECTAGNGNTYAAGICVGALKNVSKLFYYVDENNSVTAEHVNVMLFYNDYGVGDDLRYETVSFLRYLVETYN